MKDGWTTGKGLGLGLSGSKRLVNDFEIDSRPGAGTRVIIMQMEIIESGCHRMTVFPTVVLVRHQSHRRGPRE